MTERETLPSLEKLGSDISRFQHKVAPKPKSASKGAGLAVRMGVELISGAFVGGISGYYLDEWLGTSPVLFILCFFLGCAGGFLTLTRALKAAEEKEK